MGTPFPAGIGTQCVGRGAAEGSATVEADGEDDALDQDLRCVGCEYGSRDESPIRLSTDNPSYPIVISMQIDDQHRLDSPASYDQ